MNCISSMDMVVLTFRYGFQVFRCVNATCGHFYHPHCVARLLHPDAQSKVDELKKKIAAGESFTCPLHQCCVCKQREDKDKPELQFAMCRRCPTSYHRKCLPKYLLYLLLDVFVDSTLCMNVTVFM